MKKELIEELFQKFEQACYVYKGVECWSARELQEILGYTKWSNFQNVIEKARDACKNAGAKVLDHFADIGKMVELGSGSQREVDDEHVDNNLAVRKMLLNRGVKPETLPAAEDVSKVKRRLESDQKKVLKEVKTTKRNKL